MKDPKEVDRLLKNKNKSKRCNNCGKVIRAKTEKQVDFLLKQHKGTKHNE